jgi:hypothetical protein
MRQYYIYIITQDITLLYVTVYLSSRIIDTWAVRVFIWLRKGSEYDF